MTAPWLQVGGLRYDLAVPNPEVLSIRDVARGLSYLNRFTGHAGLYSVAQHCVLGTRVLRDEGYTKGIQRAFLLHDAHEIVTGDVASPIKIALRDVFRGSAWERFERTHRIAFARRFGIPSNVPRAVSSTDLRMLVTEARQLLPPPPQPWNIPAEPIEGLRIVPWTPDRACAEYMCEAVRLEIS